MLPGGGGGGNFFTPGNDRLGGPGGGFSQGAPAGGKGQFKRGQDGVSGHGGAQTPPACAYCDASHTDLAVPSVGS